eukprot:13582676-Ditylum_brightwellii.AAC.1
MQDTRPIAAEQLSSGGEIIKAENGNKCMGGAKRRCLSGSLLIAASGLTDLAESVRPSKKARLSNAQQTECLQEKMQQIDTFSTYLTTLTSMRGTDNEFAATFPEK